MHACLNENVTMENIFCWFVLKGFYEIPPMHTFSFVMVDYYEMCRFYDPSATVCVCVCEC